MCKVSIRSRWNGWVSILTSLILGVRWSYLVGGLEASVGYLRDRQLLVGSLLCRDDRGVGHEGEVDAGVGHQVGLELCQVHV